MFLAREFDAVDELGPFLSPERERVVSPDVHSRVIGYLATAPEVSAGYRTDGVWVWPAALVGHLRECGAMPQRALLEHLRERWFLLPESVDDEVLAEAGRAAHGQPTPAETPPTAYVIGEPTPPSTLRTLLRRQRAPDGKELEDSYYRDGWASSDFLSDRPRVSPLPLTYHDVSAREAARFNDELWRLCHDDAVSAERETVAVAGGLRFARTYDGEGPGGAPWFSPGRLRLPEAVRRERVAAYLSGGRTAFRAGGHMIDPLEPEAGPVVPLTYRTDGVWVWQEALAYYVRRRGVAPELELLCHIEERGYLPPPTVSAEAVSAAAAIVQKGPMSVPDRPPVTYFAAQTGAFLHRSRGGHAADAQRYGRDKRWTVSDLLWRQEYGGSSDYEIEPISEAAAVSTVDSRWARGGAVPPIR